MCASSIHYNCFHGKYEWLKNSLVSMYTLWSAIAEGLTDRWVFTKNYFIFIFLWFWILKKKCKQNNKSVARSQKPMLLLILAILQTFCFDFVKSCRVAPDKNVNINKRGKNFRKQNFKVLGKPGKSLKIPQKTTFWKDLRETHRLKSWKR